MVRSFAAAARPNCCLRTLSNDVIAFAIPLLFVLLLGCSLGLAQEESSEQENKSVAPKASAPVQRDATESVGDKDDDKVADDKKANDKKADEKNDGKLFFSFGGSRWKEVVEWLASSSDLALHYNDLPTGTFTYSDTRFFTLQEAIDRVNLFMLPEGYTLVRSGRLLSVINLSDPRSLKQLDSLARLVKYEDLDSVEDHDVIKCIFPLGDLDAADAVEELGALNLFQTPSVFTKTNQLMITDAAGKLKTAKKILSAFKPKTLDNGTVVKSFTLKHVDAEDVLMVARPHLGLATGEMIGIDVSVSADVKGKNIFVTGIEDKVLLIEGLISQIDQPKATITGTGEAKLKSYLVPGGNVEIIYNVLLTLLAKKDVRLSMDTTTGAIVALATPDVHQEIQATVEQLKAAESEFAVIQLKSVDPFFAISLLEEMLDIDDSDESDSSNDPFRGGRWWEYGRFGGQQEDSNKETPPKIDADPGNMRLFVRGKKEQIAQIKKIIEEIDKGTVGTGEQMRIFPLTGKKAEEALTTAAKFWQAKNPIFYFPADTQEESKPKEKSFDEEPPTESKTNSQPSFSKPAIAKLLTANPNSLEPAIRCQPTPRGILIQSEDTNALDQFEKLLRTVVGPSDTAPAVPTVYYLKYTKPNDALRMLAELLDGGAAAQEAEAGTLVNGYVSGSSSSFLGSIVTSREGTLTMINDSITVVADPRLNRLIAQGTASDIELIEGYLKIVDKDSSITSIQTHGTSHVIELEHVSASEVATAIRDAYFGRVAGSNSSANSAQQRGGQQQPQQRGRGDEQQGPGGDQRGENGKPNQQANRQRQPNSSGGQGMEPKMTIAVHEASNSLIVTAPDQLFKEVEQLVKLIDSRSRQTVEILKLPRNFSGDLKQILAGEVPVQPQRSNRSRTSTDRRQPSTTRRDR